jgi:hypothetical protein
VGVAEAREAGVAGSGAAAVAGAEGGTLVGVALGWGGGATVFVAVAVDWTAATGFRLQPVIKITARSTVPPAVTELVAYLE